MTKSWSNMRAILNPDFGIAPDVTFLFVLADAGTQPGEVKAHRLILGLLSPVFRNQFYGPAQDTEDVISVKGTNKKAFQTLIDFIYGKKIYWKVMSLSQLFDVVNLAEMYFLPELMEEVKKPIENYVLTDENLIEAAAMAEAFNHFAEASAALMTHCQNVLKVKIKTLQDAAEFASMNAATEFANLALKLLGSLKIQGCSNCRSNPCKDGEWVVDINTLTVGCVLAKSFGPSVCSSHFKVVNVNVEREEFSVCRVGSVDTVAGFKIGSWFYACKNS